MIKGKITRISGPIVYAEGLEGCGLYDVVDVGEKKIIGEIIRQNKGIATIQVYEDDTGMKIGEDVVSNERPLSLKLGPGLVGTIYDGIQRPLETMYKESGAFLVPGQRSEPIDATKVWHFDACEGVKEGTPIKPGFVLGTVQETQSILHKIMVPPQIRGRVLVSFKGSGDYTVDDVIAKTELDEEIRLSHYWSLRTPRPFAKKLTVSQPLVTGQRVIDVFFPLSKGGTAAIPGGFGTGKTMTQHAIAKWCDADLIVYIGCGERGNEMTDVLREFPELKDPRSGYSLMKRTVLIANTSDMPVAAREASIYTGITIAEYFRDMGYSVAVIADSSSRWAEALREMSGRLEEMPGEEGYPAYLTSRLAQFYERAGNVICLGSDARHGTLSAIGAVSPQGGDISEPVSQATLRIVKVFWGLDSSLAYRRHFPAINWLTSYSLYKDKLEEWFNANVARDWNAVTGEAMRILSVESELEEIVKLVGVDALSPSERLTLEAARSVREDFLQQNAFEDGDSYTSLDKQYRLIKLILSFYKKSGDALKRGADIEKIADLSVREKIGRAKSADPEKYVAEYEDIDREITAELAALTDKEDR